MFKRQREGSVICTSCGVLVGVNDPTCYNCGRRNPGLWGFGPALRRLGNDMGFVPVVTGATIVLFVLSLVMSRGGVVGLLQPASQILFLLGASGAGPVFAADRWWTVLTAGWLHGGLMHIFFNVLWIRQLAPEIANLYGAGRMIIIYTVSGVIGFTLSSVAGLFLLDFPVPFLRGAYFTVGASAPIFGLLGALVHYGRRTRSSHIGHAGLQYALLMGVFGLIFPGVDNYAHLGGFIGGYLSSLILDPLKPERIDHLLIAVICLGATLAAVVWSVVTALPYFVQ